MNRHRPREMACCSPTDSTFGISLNRGPVKRIAAVVLVVFACFNDGNADL